MTAINFEVLIAVGSQEVHLSVLLVSRTSQLYTPVFCASEVNVQHSSTLVGTKCTLFNPSEGVENVQPIKGSMLQDLLILPI